MDQDKFIYPKFSSVQKFAYFLTHQDILSLDLLLKNSHLLFQKKCLNLKPSRSIEISSTDDRSNQSKIKKEFQELFECKEKVSYLKYILKITKIKEFKTPIILLSGFFYKKSVESLALKDWPKNCTIKLFACCFFIAQKMSFDVDFYIEDIGKLLNFPPEDLRTNEIFIISRLLEFDISVTKKDWLDYLNFMNNILPWIQAHRHLNKRID